MTWSRDPSARTEPSCSTVTRQLKGKLLASGRSVSLELMRREPPGREEPSILEAFFKQRREDFHLTGLEFIDPKGAVVAASFASDLDQPPPVILPSDDPAAPQAEEVIRQVIPQGELLTLSVPFRNSAGALAGYVVVRQLIPQDQLLQIAAAANSLQDLRRRHLLFSPVRVSHYLTLIIVTLIAMMAAIWLALYMAREITTPIRQLAEGTVKVAGGNYDIHIEQESRDEIGFLVQSFNKMTQDMQQSQAQ